VLIILEKNQRFKSLQINCRYFEQRIQQNKL